MSSQNPDLYTSLIKLSKSMRQFSSLLTQEFKITINEFYVLYICSEQDNVDIDFIKKKLHLTAASLSRILSKMFDRGYISRDFGKSDKRKILITATVTGIELNNFIKESILKINNKLFTDEETKNDMAKIVFSSATYIESMGKKSI